MATLLFQQISQSATAPIGRSLETNELISIGDIERRSGLYILGKPGMGKSSLLVNLINSDIQNGHGLFFLDPHADAIADIIDRCGQNSRLLSMKLLDPETETHSFGINILSCADITSLKQCTDTYSRAYGIFHKLWEDEWGPWLQLIIQNTIYAFVENQEYTLSEVPLFLNNPEFRNQRCGENSSMAFKTVHRIIRVVVETGCATTAAACNDAPFQGTSNGVP